MRALASLLIGILLSSFSYGFELPSQPFICVRGRAVSEIAPDIARLEFSIGSFDASYKRSLETVQRKSARVIAFLKELKIDRKDVQSYHISAYREYDRNTRELKGVRCARKFSITLRDINLFDRVVAKLHEFEAGNRMSVSFDSSKRKQLEDQLLEGAIKNSISKAQRLVKGYGVKLGKVYAISEIDFTDISDRFIPAEGGYAGMGAMGEARLFVPATIEVSAKIHVIFLIDHGK